MCKKKGY
jgi:cyclophilin family peptidyl-prolyl cis-trans isomerase